MRLLRDLIQLFDRRERWKLGVLSLLLFGGSLLEIVGIGIILPFIKIVGDPAAVLSNQRINPWLTRLGLDTPRSGANRNELFSFTS
jgi:ATP-binding cassette, subfamily B, bacterial PglK